MKAKYFIFLLPALCFIQGLRAQTYLKLNALYAAVGVVNPAVEFRVSPKSTFQAEIVYSPWESIKGKPMRFAIFMNEFRRYLRERNSGWYLGANGGMMGFKMSKPEFRGGKIRLEDRYSKGYGFMVGLSAGYEYKFARRWLLDAYIGWAYMLSWYNGYALDGTLDLYPHRPVMPDPPDSFNGSAEWYPNKIGVSVGFLIFDPARRAKTGK